MLAVRLDERLLVAVDVVDVDLAEPQVDEVLETRKSRFPVFIDADGIVRAVILQQMDTDTAVAQGEALLED